MNESDTAQYVDSSRIYKEVKWHCPSSLAAHDRVACVAKLHPSESHWSLAPEKRSQLHEYDDSGACDL